eukprot:TRINITY_DN249_c0_g1_i3.p1 TRINITY_DN249_c0_g1~~TRINITY_DN249_c0_g1_i3.p1  ORF type:complete len:1007 (+),score=278.71 TRINITY_DN249_c0_g1_i3:163-3183(+)
MAYRASQDLVHVTTEGSSSPLDVDLAVLIARIQESPDASNYATLQRFFQERIDNQMAVHISKENATRLCRVLMLRASDKTENKLRPQMTQTAKMSLELLFGFAREVDEVQDVLEPFGATELGNRLKLERHLMEDDPDHVLMTTDFITFLSTNYPKFKDWKAFVGPSVHDIVLQNRDSLPKRSFDQSAPRLSSASHMPPEGNYYDTEIDQLVNVFHTNLGSGLDSIDAATRQNTYGKNSLPVPDPPGILRMIWNQLADFLVLILLLAAVLSAALGDFIAAAALALVVFINVLIGFTQEYKAERALAALNSLDVPQAKVYRDGGNLVELNSAELVPGDIVELQSGGLVPADLRIFEAVDLQIKESILTGESDAIEKITEAIPRPNLGIGDRKNMAFMSTEVEKGRGKGIVVSTGKNTEVGKISKDLLSAGSKVTALQRKISRLGKILVLIAVVLCAIIFGIGVARGRVPILEMVKVAISLAVSVIPEGLVAVVTITFAFGVKRMLNQNAIVRRLPAVETLGSVTTICSDKTGTLTEGKMCCQDAYADGEEYSFSGTGVSPEGEVLNSSEQPLMKDCLPRGLERLITVAVMCNTSGIRNGDKAKGEPEWVGVGNPTEVAMVCAGLKAGVSKEQKEAEGWKCIRESPFDSGRKRMSVVYRDDSGRVLVLCKGAPERLVKQCTGIFDDNGGDETQPFTEDMFQRIENRASDMAKKGLRVLGLGFRELNLSEEEIMELDTEELECNLTLVGLMGLIDPPREPVKRAVEQCNEAGIHVIMITGDHPTTAKTIAQKLGILTEEYEGAVMKGPEVDALTDEQIIALPNFPCVFARVSPQNKLAIVTALQKRGEIVAMTGDGVNDAPAIKHSDMGIAMGITGTDLTKQSAEMILMDDNFSTIILAIKEGRRTYDNIIKFVMYLLSANSAEIFVMMMSVAIGLPIPFTAVMILWANLFADIPPGGYFLLVLFLSFLLQSSHPKMRTVRSRSYNKFGKVGTHDLSSHRKMENEEISGI